MSYSSRIDCREVTHVKFVMRNAYAPALLLIAIFIAIMPISPASAAPTNVTPNSLEPTFGYAISASPTAARVTQGQSVTLEVLVDWFAGAPQPVTLSVSGPAQMSYSFSSNPVTPNGYFTVSLRITTANNLPAGQSYTLTITGTNGATTRSTTVNVWVDYPITTY